MNGDQSNADVQRWRLLRCCPFGTVGKFEGVQRIRLHCRAVSGLRGRNVAAVFHDQGVDEMLVKVVRVLGDAIFQTGTHANVVEHRQVLDDSQSPTPPA